jgi:hypothetical protein
MNEPNKIVIDSLKTENNYKLRSPKGNNLMTSKLYTAFTRDTLGSIPRNSEIILFKENNFNEKKGFLTQDYRFPDRADNLKNSFPGPGQYHKEKINLSPSHSSKGYGNAFVSKSQRFNDSKEFFEGFYPGPQEYSNTNLTLKDLSSRSLKFKSLYKNKHIVNMKQHDATPGPGQYDINKSNTVDKNFLNSVFASKYERNIVKKLDYVSEPGKFYRDIQLVKELNMKSSFFFSHSPPKVNPIEKVLNIEDNAFRIPGVGNYDVTKQWPMVRHNYDSKKEYEERIKEEKEFNKKASEHDKMDNKQRRRIKKSELLVFENNGIKNSAKYIFESKAKKLADPTTHVPGPCYYKNTNKLPNKVEFRYNYNNIWY